MEIAKAIVLAGRTAGDRPWPVAPVGPKHLVPVANRPILFHHLESLRAAGMLEATIAVDPGDGPAFERAVGDGSEWELSIRCAEWPSGELPALLSRSREFVGDEPVVVLRGDALLRDRMHAHVRAFARERLDAVVIRAGAAGTARTTVACMLSPLAVSLLLEGQAADRADPVSTVRERGGRVDVREVDACLPCHGTQDALLDSNRCLLEDLPGDEERVWPGCEVQGPVQIHPSARLERAAVRGPAIIGPGCRVRDAYIGPYTSVGAGVVIEGAEIEHSIVLAHAELRFVGVRLESSVIGRGARIARGFRLPSAMRVSLGEGAEIALS